ncbi:hypothetical protein Tco_1320541 [Tanacetum coccineum]
MEALTNFNVSEAFEKVGQAKVLTEIKKLLPTHIPNAISNYFKPHLNTSVLEVMKTNQINLFTQSSTSIDDLSEMDLKLKRLNRIHLNKSNDTHTTHQKLYDIHYESIILDQDALDAQALQSSFHKRSQDNKDPQTSKGCRSFERHMSKSTKPHPCFYNNDYTYLVDLNTGEKYTTSITKNYATRYYKEGIEDRIPERWSKEIRRYHFEALNGIHHWEEDRIDFFKARMSVITEGNVYSDLRIKSVVRIILSKVKKFCDGILVKIQENLIDMLSKNKLGSGNKRLKGRDWTDYDVKSLKEMLKKIDAILRCREQLKRLEEYVGGRPKTINPRTFIRPLQSSLRGRLLETQKSVDCMAIYLSLIV